jgi:hypothetical protein
MEWATVAMVRRGQQRAFYGKKLARDAFGKARLVATALYREKRPDATCNGPRWPKCSNPIGY